MVERVFSLVACSNVVLCVAVLPGLFVMLFGRLVMIGGDNMMFNDTECYWRCQGGG